MQDKLKGQGVEDELPEAKQAPAVPGDGENANAGKPMLREGERRITPTTD